MELQNYSKGVENQRFKQWENGGNYYVGKRNNEKSWVTEEEMF